MSDGVTCANCGAVGAAGQRFCGTCGQALAVACPTCGTANPPDHRFCGSCGSALSAPGGGNGATAATAAVPGGTGPSTAFSAAPVPSAAAPGAAAAPGHAPTVAERRLVSVLFADLVGFTPFAEERDAEDVRDTLTRYFDLASEIIRRYGGTVEKFIGDAVMAVWGTPTAREDDAERAVRAGIDLVDSVRSLGPAIQARAGILTGETAVTLGATNQGMVAGDLVNTAARLQSVAAPGTVLVGESTYRAASGAIAFEAAGDQALKGKAAPVPAWRAIRVVAERGGRGRAEQLEAPFVGRDVELRLLKDLYHATGTERRVRHVSVIGTGGIGKSRLAWELEKYLDGISETAVWHHGRSPAYGEGITFWALGEMVRQRAGLVEGQDEATTRAKVAALLDERMASHPDRRWVEAAILQLLGVASGLPSNELFGAWRTFFEALAGRGTVVLVFQDLHWADSGTLDFIDHLLEWSRGQPIFIVSLARPELLERRPDWSTARRGFTSVFLEPLPEPAMRELLGGLVPGLPPGTATEIARRAEGVPLYAIETIRMLVNDGRLVAGDDGALRVDGDLSELAVPETLTALIAARLDALDPADRSLLLDAAVLGQSFTPESIAAITEGSTADIVPRLRSLVRRELLTNVADPRSPERGQYSFVQALIREVAYNTLSKKDRKARHLAAARWFESLGEPELVGALAGHYLAARALAAEGAEADALAAQARLALKAAADRAASLGAHRQAMSFFEQALEVTSDVAEEAELHRRVGESATVSSNWDAAEEHFERALAIHRERNERSAAARLSGTLGQMLLSGKRVDRAFAVLEAAATEFADLGDDPARLGIIGQIARARFLTGDPARAIETADEILPIVERMDQLFLLADTLVTKGSALANVGRPREGRGVLAAGAKIAQEQGFSGVELRSINNGLSGQTDTDPRAAFESGVTGLALARRLGQGSWIHSFSGNLAYVTLRTGEFDTALAEVDDALADTTDPLDRMLLVNNRVDILAFRGLPLDEGMRELEATYAAHPTEAGVFTLESRAFVAMLAGHTTDARAAWLDLYAADPTNSFVALLWVARLSLWQGDAAAATDYLERYWAVAVHEGAVLPTRDIIAAGIAALSGQHDVAVAGYRDALDRLRPYRVPIDEVFATIDMVHALGPTEPLVGEAIASARAVIGRVRAAPLAELLDSAIADSRDRAASASAKGATALRAASTGAAGSAAAANSKPS
jgi:class 3 adenylate cyclase/tetratricopeptide (TPR) repeat protein